jgi:hypothetical protein
MQKNYIIQLDIGYCRFFLHLPQVIILNYFDTDPSKLYNFAGNKALFHRPKTIFVGKTLSENRYLTSFSYCFLPLRSMSALAFNRDTIQNFEYPYFLMIRTESLFCNNLINSRIVSAKPKYHFRLYDVENFEFLCNSLFFMAFVKTLSIRMLS